MSTHTARKVQKQQIHRQDSVARLRERKRIKRRRKRNQKIFMSVFLAALCGTSFWLGRITAPKPEVQGEKGGGSRTSGSSVDGAKVLNTVSTEESSSDMTTADMISYVQSHPKEYPEQLRSFLETNLEAVDFVYHYPENQNQSAKDIDLSGEYKEGEIPLLIQWDKRWGYEQYGDDMIALSGCGPVCLSMIYVGLTGDTTMNPKAMSKFSSENGYYLEGVGTSWELMSSGAESLGLSWSNPALHQAELFAELDAGHPLICSMLPGDFTSTGHFIVIYGHNGDNLLIHDPNSPERSAKEWPYKQVESQIKNVWAYSKAERDPWNGISKIWEAG